MNKRIRSGILNYFNYIFISFVCVSCITSKQITNFQDLSDSTKMHNLRLPPYIMPVIHNDDVLTVDISTVDDKVTSVANSTSNPLAASAAPSGGDLPVGLQVDSLGMIEKPVLGKIAVAGLTIPEITELVRQKALKYFINPIVTVKLKTFKVTILGEVAKPGPMYISTPKATIIDVLALSGDLTVYAKRNDILLLRRNNDNTLSTIRIDFTNSNVFSQPYYYVQSNDVFYVKPNNSKAISSDAVFNRNLTLGTLGLSVLTTILYFFR